MSANDMIDDDTFLFAGQNDDVDIEEVEVSEGVWRILIVDDEPEIHKVTELALANLRVSNRRFEFLHAYTGEEAIALLKRETDIAVILLDVVMESDDAGLKVVEKIREELLLTDVRIILRTGQPGYAPEEQVVMQYDINDYKTKTELTRNKLLTSIFSAIRSYQQLRQISQSKDFLQSLNQINSELISQPDLMAFVEVLVRRSIDLFGTNGDGVLLIDHPLEQNEVKDDGFWITYGTGEMSGFEGVRFEKALSGRAIHLITKAITQQQHQIEEDGLVIYVKAQSCVGVLLLESKFPVEISTELLQAFVSNVASDLDNSLLIRKVSDIAYRDALTNLPNRTRFIQLLDEYTTGRLEGDTVVLLDIDHFSDINDGLGQEAGNKLLIAVASRLTQQLDSSVTVCRIGADIFGLIGSSETLETNTLLTIFHKSFRTGDHFIPINATLGICRKFANDKNGLAVLKHANIALNRAKKDIRSRFNYYETEMEDETSWRLGMIRRLTNDFHDGKLQVWYQPQVNVETGKVIGMEALLRWPNGEGGFVSPVTFIPLAEYSGLIVEIGAWVLEQSCKQVKRLQEMSFSELRVAVNVSMPQFRNINFVDKVIETTKTFDVDPKYVELEITESVVMDDPKLVIQALEKLKQNHFTIAIDDFGTGFSSLSYLHQLPLDRLKVDREFIKDIGEGGDGIIAETVINLGQRLGLETIAEGIETQFQLDYVRKLGCDEAQGYFHAKPMPAEELEQFLLTQK